MDADELRHKTKQALAAKGYKLDSAYGCRINIELAGEGAGCRVTFGKGFGHTNYIVPFNTKGEAGKVETQLVLEGHSFPK
jgi:hypothetical protein